MAFTTLATTRAPTLGMQAVLIKENAMKKLTPILFLLACHPPDATDRAPHVELAAQIGSEGGTLVGAPRTALEGVTLVIPPGALSMPTPVRISGTIDTTPLPSLAERVGLQVRIEPAETQLAAPASLTLPVRAELV